MIDTIMLGNYSAALEGINERYERLYLAYCALSDQRAFELAIGKSSGVEAVLDKMRGIASLMDNLLSLAFLISIKTQEQPQGGQ